MRVYLASTSPARLTLLRSAGIEPIVIPPCVDEENVVHAAETQRGTPLDAPELVQLLARAKAEAVLGTRINNEPLDGFICGGDSVFVYDGKIFGKPHTPHKAFTRWQQQIGRTGHLYSGHWLIDHRGGTIRSTLGKAAVASVSFVDDLTEEELNAYIATEEPLTVAGAFTADGLAGPFIKKIEGDPSTIIGLSLPTLRELVRACGVSWHSLWNRV